MWNVGRTPVLGEILKVWPDFLMRKDTSRGRSLGKDGGQAGSGTGGKGAATGSGNRRQSMCLAEHSRQSQWGGANS